MRSTFDRGIMNLLNDVNAMGSRVDRVIGDTYTAVKDKDFVLSKQIYEDDHKINDMETAIEQSAISLIALQQPVATDLRRITAALKLVTDIERIGDQCADICEIMNSNPIFHKFDTPKVILQMFEKVQGMFVDSLESYVQLDDDLARDVIARDDHVDDDFNKAVLELTNRIVEDKKYKEHAVDYLFIAKCIERIGDHATNISEWTLYVTTGVHFSMDDHTDSDDSEV